MKKCKYGIEYGKSKKITINAYNGYNAIADFREKHPRVKIIDIKNLGEEEV